MADPRTGIIIRIIRDNCTISTVLHQSQATPGSIPLHLIGSGPYQQTLGHWNPCYSSAGPRGLTHTRLDPGSDNRNGGQDSTIRSEITKCPVTGRLLKYQHFTALGTIARICLHRIPISCGFQLDLIHTMTRGRRARYRCSVRGTNWYRYDVTVIVQNIPYMSIRQYFVKLN